MMSAGGMDRTLKYSYRDTTPLRSVLGDSSSWDSKFKQATRDLKPDEPSGNNGDAPPPSDGSGAAPQYVVNKGDEAETGHSGSGSSQSKSGETFELAGRDYSESWELRARGPGGSDDHPLEIEARGMLGSIPGSKPLRVTIDDQVDWSQEFQSDGLHRTGNGQRTTIEELSPEKVSGLFFGSFAWAEGRLEVQVLRDCLQPIPIPKGRAPVDTGANGLKFRGGQRLVDPLGPAR